MVQEQNQQKLQKECSTHWQQRDDLEGVNECLREMTRMLNDFEKLTTSRLLQIEGSLEMVERKAALLRGKVSAMKE